MIPNFSFKNSLTLSFAAHWWICLTFFNPHILPSIAIVIGTLAQLRTTTVSYKNHQRIDKDESEWAVIENNHEAIIAMPRFKNHGKMSKSHKIEKPGIIINTEPKARREYYTNKGGSGGKHGKFWLNRMKADRGSDILRGLKR